jgi:spermidine/putrescine transport system substrate-binding protein
MGDHFDLICPSEYMIMKLAAENRLQKLPADFYRTDVETNYYAKYVSPYILSTFSENYVNGDAKSDVKGDAWKEYAAGYMWGTTGFVYHPDYVNEEDVKSWSVFTNTDYAKKITAKNNIRDSYFVGLAMYYENELQTLKTQYEQRELTRQEYQAELSRLMNDSSPETMSGVKAVLQSMTSNLYGFETDEGKNDTIAGKITVNYQWSGDAVYIMDTAEYGEEDEEPEYAVKLNYSIPETVSNLWFDGWVLTKDCKDVDAATMFINFLSRPDNAVDNMTYIGYTSCIAGDEVFDEFVTANYATEEETEWTYDLNYFFNPDYVADDPTTHSDAYVFYVEEEQLKRQLFAQYPQESVLARCVAMQYFDADANSRANSMWSDITFF